MLNKLPGRHTNGGLGVGFIDNLENRERLRLEAEKGWLRGFVLYVLMILRIWIGTVYSHRFHGNSWDTIPNIKVLAGMYLTMRM